MNTPEKDQISELISAYCKGELTQERAEELKQWLKADPDHREMLIRYRSIYGEARAIGLLEQMDKEKAWSEISNAITKPKTRKLQEWLPYAAAVAVVAFVSLLLLYQTRMEVDSFRKYDLAQVAEAGSRKAVLTLGNGAKVKLHEEQRQSISEVDGTRINKDTSNNITYNLADSSNFRLIYNSMEVPRGGEWSLTLSDGTKVWLNSDSKLRYPVKFKPNRRDVYLVGEAYFEVAHNKDAPFMVHALDSKVKVLGTKFNVSSYSEQEFIVTTLVEGSVEVKNLSSVETLKPGLQSIITRGKDEIEVKQVDTHLYTSWVDGVFEFEDMELEYIMAQLGRWYNVKFFFTEERFKHIRFTGAIKRSKPFDFALEMIVKIADVEFAVQDEYIIVGRPKK